MTNHAPSHSSTRHDGAAKHHYAMLAAMVALSFVSMYALMYAMVYSFGDVFNSVNQVYMAGLMAAPMALIELALMRSMYRDNTLNMIVIAASVIALIAFFILIRQQTAIGDRQFLRSMIPHHSGAVLMCERATITDPEIKKLCGEIISSQKSEIDQMRAILDRLNK